MNFSEPTYFFFLDPFSTTMFLLFVLGRDSLDFGRSTPAPQRFDHGRRVAEKNLGMEGVSVSPNETLPNVPAVESQPAHHLREAERDVDSFGFVFRGEEEARANANVGFVLLFVFAVFGKRVDVGVSQRGQVVAGHDAEGESVTPGQDRVQGSHVGGVGHVQENRVPFQLEEVATLLGISVDLSHDNVVFGQEVSGAVCVHSIRLSFGSPTPHNSGTFLEDDRVQTGHDGTRLDVVFPSVNLSGMVGSERARFVGAGFLGFASSGFGRVGGGFPLGTSAVGGGMLPAAFQLAASQTATTLTRFCDGVTTSHFRIPSFFLYFLREKKSTERVPLGKPRGNPRRTSPKKIKIEFYFFPQSQLTPLGQLRDLDRPRRSTKAHCE